MNTPTEIRRIPNIGLQISWSDGTNSALSTRTLRTLCPCASCKEARGDGSHEKPLTAPLKKRSLTVIEHTADEELDLKNVWGVGNYAIGLEWGDGHSTGIYTYEYLRSLSAV